MDEDQGIDEMYEDLHDIDLYQDTEGHDDPIDLYFGDDTWHQEYHD